MGGACKNAHTDKSTTGRRACSCSLASGWCRLAAGSFQVSILCLGAPRAPAALAVADPAMADQKVFKRKLDSVGAQKLLSARQPLRDADWLQQSMGERLQQAVALLDDKKRVPCSPDRLLLDVQE